MKRLRCAIVGCGGYAGAHARRLKARPEVEITALCSRSESSIERLVERRLAECEPAPARYTSTSEMFAREELDAVVISTPHHLHFPQAVEALEAGCHVLIEKPMVTSLSEAVVLSRLASEVSTGEGRRVVGVAFNPAFSEPMKRVRDAVAGGTYGRLELVTGYLAQDWKRLTAGSWRQEPKLSGGGQAMDSGAHLIHSLISGVSSAPVELLAYSDSLDAAVDINTVVAVRFANGVLATLTIGGNSAVDGGSMSFIFDGGRIDVDGWKGGWFRGSRPGEELDLLEECGEPSPDDSFVDAILGRGELPATVDDGLRVAAFLDALYRSVESGAPEAVFAEERR